MLYIIERYQKLILRGGLYYGCVGTLIFLCLYQYIDRDINNSDLIKNLFNIVCEEFYESVDNSFETGKLGIAIALEFVAPYLWQLYNQELIEALNCINETIINNILNYAYGNMPLYASHVYNIYFTAREFGKRMNNADKSAKTYLNRHKKSVRSIVTVMHNQWNWSLGIKGVGGLGLSLLSNRFNKNEINWTFLLSEIREK